MNTPSTKRSNWPQERFDAFCKTYIAYFSTPDGTPYAHSVIRHINELVHVYNNTRLEAKFLPMDALQKIITADPEVKERKRRINLLLKKRVEEENARLKANGYLDDNCLLRIVQMP